MRDTIDLRTDAVNQPTESMWEAMRAANLGWASIGEDQAVARLESVVSASAGMEAASFLPTGTMGNLAALLAHCRPGDQAIAESASHILWSEGTGFASVAGITIRPLVGHGGSMPVASIREALEDRRFGQAPTTSLVCLEISHNASGGRVMPSPVLRATCTTAHELGAMVHVDGARIMNACVASGTALRSMLEGVDSVMISLNKGLGAPQGAVLCGSAEFVERARTAVRRMGGGSMASAGLLAAAGLVAFETMVDRLRDDHENAVLLGRGLAELSHIVVDVEAIETNIVMARLPPDFSGSAFIDALRLRGVLTLLYVPDTVRFVLHRGIATHDIDLVVAACAEAVRSARR